VERDLTESGELVWLLPEGHGQRSHLDTAAGELRIVLKYGRGVPILDLNSPDASSPEFHGSDGHVVPPP
jgi:hypothetical protein